MLNYQRVSLYDNQLFAMVYGGFVYSDPVFSINQVVLANLEKPEKMSR